MFFAIALSMLVASLTQPSVDMIDPCPPPSQFQGRPYFDFQVAKEAAYVDSLGTPIPSTLKLLIQPQTLSIDSVMLALTQWRYQPAIVAECRVPQLVQTPLRWK